MYLLTKMVGAVVAPLTGMILWLLLGLGLLWTRRHWKAGRVVLSALALTLVVTVVSPLQPFLTETLENRFTRNPPLPNHIDGIIVLGGSINPQISLARQQICFEDSAERLVEAAVLARRFPSAKLLFSGGSADPSDPEASEAPLAGKLLRALGVEPENLLLEGRSRNTFENGVFSQQIAKPNSGEIWLLITSARHMPRAVGVFRRIGWPVIPWPVDFKSGGTVNWINIEFPLVRLRTLSLTMHEWLGLLYYRLRGWSDSLFPEP